MKRPGAYRSAGQRKVSEGEPTKFITDSRSQRIPDPYG